MTLELTCLNVGRGGGRGALNGVGGGMLLENGVDVNEALDGALNGVVNEGGGIVGLLLI